MNLGAYMFLGRGLVEAEDDLRLTNPPSNEELLTALARDFASHGFDVRRLMRQIMESATYARSANPSRGNAVDEVYYSHYLVRRLPAEVILDAYSQVTGVPTPFSGYPAGMRALQLPDTQVKSEFLTVFGRPARQVCDSSERSSDATIAQALHVINGDTLNKKLSATEGYVGLFLKLGLSDSRILEHIFLTAFSRYPTAAEKAALLPDLKQGARRQALEDVLWALLTDKEFLFNH